MILFTDIGKDIDDAVALAYAIISGVPVTTIVVTSKDSKESANICRNMVDAMSDDYPEAKKIKILMGSDEPLKKGMGKFHNNIYKGEFSKGHHSFKKYDPEQPSTGSKDGDAVVIGPLTDVLGPVREEKIKRILFMGQAVKGYSDIQPDMQSYNFKCDSYASNAVFQFQDKVSFAFIGKTIAYKVPLTRDDFEELGAIDHPVAKFLKDHAFTSFDFFKANVPDLYEKIYKGTNNIAYCYDPLCIVALTNPELFTFEKFGTHRIAVDINANMAKSTLFGALKKGLSR